MRNLFITIVTGIFLMAPTVMSQDYVVLTNRPDKVDAKLVPSIKCLKDSERPRSVPDSITVMVGIEGDNLTSYWTTVFVRFQVAFRLNGDTQRKNLIQGLEKALKWSAQSRRNQLNIEKDLFRLEGEAPFAGSFLDADFESRDNGSNCEVCLHFFRRDIVSGRNKSGFVYVSTEEIRHLVMQLKKVPSILPKLKDVLAKARKADDLLK